MKVLYLITKGVWGGASRYVFDLAETSQKLGDEVVVVCGQGRALPEKLARSDIRTICLPFLGRDVNPLADWQSFIAIYRLLRKERPDIVHLNSPKIGGLGALAARLVNLVSRHKSLVIYTAHGWPFNEPRNWLAQATIKLFSWLTIMLCHQTIVIAKKELEQALAMPLVTRYKLALIYNGMATPKFLARNEARQKLAELEPKLQQLPPTTKWLGCIAELHNNKGLRYLLAAMHQLPESLILIIIGEGEERVRLEKIIDDLELSDRVFLLGKIPDAATYLPALDVFTLASVKEGLPYVLLEAGLARLPVVSTKIGGIPEIIEAGQHGLLVPPANPEALAKALEHLSHSPIEAEAYATSLQSRVQANFSLNQMSKLTRQIYQQALK